MRRNLHNDKFKFELCDSPITIIVPLLLLWKQMSSSLVELDAESHQASTLYRREGVLHDPLLNNENSQVW